MALSTAGVILAGGRALRMSGVRKGLLRIGGTTVIQRLLNVYRLFFSEIRIAAREQAPYKKFQIPISQDTFTTFSSLNGIHTALHSVQANHVFVAACDTPFLQPALVSLLLSRLTPAADVVVPLLNNNYYEPLCAIYSKRCLPHIVSQLKLGEYQIIRFFRSVNVVSVSETEIRQADPELASFTNINTRQELRNVVLNEHMKRQKKNSVSTAHFLGASPVPRPNLSRFAFSKRIR